jgi:hypothetical protein
MQIIGDIARLFPGFLDAGGGRRNEFGARFGLYGQCGNDVDHGDPPGLLFWLYSPGGTLAQKRDRTQNRCPLLLIAL